MKLLPYHLSFWIICISINSTLLAQLAEPVDLTTPREAVRDAESGDLNGDGILDLVVVQDDPYNSKYLVWYPGTGSGLFDTPRSISSNFVNDPEIADLDGDGDLDITFAITVSRRIGWFANDGSGNFGPAIIIADSLQGVRKATPFDLDQDGDMDILSMVDDPVFLDMNSAIVWYENDGTGSFPNGRVIFQGAIRDPWDIEGGDLDGDGDMDVAVACLNTDDVTWFSNQGGALSWSGKQVITTDLIGCTNLELGDLEGDGDLDIVVSNVGAQRVAWLRNNGAGVFTLISLSAFGLSTVDDATGVVLFDANGDGFLDVAASLLDENAIDLFLYNAPGSFSPAIRITNRTFNATCVQAADLDGDGDMDLISGSQNDAKLAWYENIGGTGTFGPNQFINQAAGGVTALAVADMDGDGDADVISVSGLDQKLALYENLGVLNFGPQQILDQSEIQPRNLVAHDLDNDGDVDLAVIGQTTLKLYLNDGSGNLSSSIVFNGFDDSRGIRAADLNNDGLTDLVVTSWFDSRLSWFENLGGGSFGGQQIIDNPGGADGLVADDWDADGDVDLAVSSEFNDQIYYYQNTGAGSFAPKVVIASSLNGLFELNSRDMNGDGRNDIIYVAFYASTVGYVPNLGSGAFAAPVNVTTALTGPWGIDAWDPDGDGDLELLVPVFSENRTVSIDNLGSGVFGSRRTVYSAYEYHRVSLPFDLDGDGDQDMIGGFKNTVTLIENLRLSAPVCDASSAPDGLTAVVNPAGVNLSWNAVPGSVACQVQGRPTGAPSFKALPPILAFEPISMLVPAARLTPGTTYEWKVRCACSIAPPVLTPLSSAGMFTVPALRLPSEFVSISSFPNPFGEMLYLEWSSQQQETALVQISDLVGRMVYSQNIRFSPGTHSIPIDASDWPAGMYYVNIPAYQQSMTVFKAED